MLDTIGYIGAICFALSALPQAYDCYKNKTAKGLSTWFLMLWLIGEVAMLIYVVPKGDKPLILNYILNLSCLLVILKYKFYSE